ncbi:MAG: VWA domain-containing protein [Planctomycetes bacterium]|nr:VWA domain-containing protein [Planctomycetota bacterium]
MPSYSSSLLAAFEFASLPMLGWLAAAILPWLIHRWNRRQRHTTSWAAVDLLLTAVGQRSRQVKLQQWLLIALRTAILLLVAMAIAEPMLGRWASDSSKVGPRHTVVILDQSYSMSRRSQGSTCLDRAKAHARRLIESRPSGDVFSVVGWAQTTDNVLGRPTSDTSLALSAIGSLSQTEEIAHWSLALRAAKAALEPQKENRPALDQTEVVFFSDLARNTWLASPEEQSQWAELAKKASLTVVNVGDGQQDNIAIVDFTVEPPLLSPGQDVSFTATLQSFGDRAWENIEVELSIDGRSTLSQQVSLAAGATSTVRFRLSLENEGPHTVQVSIGGAVDSFSSDNRRWLVIEIRPRLQVACIAGKPGAADDVARALAPGKLSADIVQTIQPKISPVSLLSELDLAKYDALFLCSAADLNQREADQVARFVRAGGGLAVFLDGQTPTEPLSQLLPVTLHESVPLGEYRFDALNYTHPIVEPFRGNENAGLLKVAVMKYRRLEIKPERQTTETVLKFDAGDLALVVDRLGLGRVAVMAIPASLAIRAAEKNPWSSFSVSPSFLPVMRELLTHLVSRRRLESQNLQVGQAAAFAWDASRPETQVTVRRPDGAERMLMTPAAEDQGIILLAETTASGIYHVSAAGEEITRFAVNLDPLESDLSTINPQELPTGITTSTASSSAKGRADYAFAPSLLAGAAICLLAELTLACGLGRGWQ